MSNSSIDYIEESPTQSINSINSINSVNSYMSYHSDIHDNNIDSNRQKSFYSSISEKQILTNYDNEIFDFNKYIDLNSLDNFKRYINTIYNLQHTNDEIQLLFDLETKEIIFKYKYNNIYIIYKVLTQIPTNYKFVYFLSLSEIYKFINDTYNSDSIKVFIIGNYKILFEIADVRRTLTCTNMLNKYSEIKIQWNIIELGNDDTIKSIIDNNKNINLKYNSNRLIAHQNNQQTEISNFYIINNSSFNIYIDNNTVNILNNLNNSLNNEWYIELDIYTETNIDVKISKDIYTYLIGDKIA